MFRLVDECIWSRNVSRFRANREISFNYFFSTTRRPTTSLVLIVVSIHSKYFYLVDSFTSWGTWKVWSYFQESNASLCPRLTPNATFLEAYLIPWSTSRNLELKNKNASQRREKYMSVFRNFWYGSSYDHVVPWCYLKRVYNFSNTNIVFCIAEMMTPRSRKVRLYFSPNDGNFACLESGVYFEFELLAR